MCSRPSRLLLVLLLLPLPGAGVERVSLTFASLEGAGLRADGVALTLTPVGVDGMQLSAHATRVRLATTGDSFDDLELECPALSLIGAEVRCPEARLRIRHPLLDRPEVSGSLSWHPDRGVSLQFADLYLLGGRWRLALEGVGAEWRVGLRGTGTDLARVVSALAGRALIPSAWRASGRADLTLDLTLNGGRPTRGAWDLSLHGGGFDDGAGGYAGEAIAADATGSWMPGSPGRLGGRAALTLRKGALSTPYAYLEPTGKPLRLDGGFVWDVAGNSLTLDSVTYAHPGVLGAQGRARLSLAPLGIQSAHVETGITPVDPLYRQYLQPVLAGGLLEQVVWRGGVGATLDQPQGGPLMLTLDLQGLGVEDARVGVSPQPPRFALSGVEGRVVWSEEAGPGVSAVSWERGDLFGALAIGPGQLRAQLGGRTMRLVEPAEIPVLDGRLLVDRLELDVAAAGHPALDFDGILTPVSMERLSSALGWPPLSGSLSGVIPRLSLRQEGISLGGNLLLRVFDGDIVVSDLRLGDLFGSLPSLNADVAIKRLDLETLTRAFAFGRITGRLDGLIDGLRLEGWRPVAFDARLQTPAGDDSDHFISQRAVDNISNLGGAGIGGSLSRTMLGLFEEFRYDRLGISCRLRNGVCRMGGVAPADAGYYLVVGRGIPQINIKGFNTETDWSRLVEQLRQITDGATPSIDFNPQDRRQ